MLTNVLCNRYSRSGLLDTVFNTVHYVKNTFLSAGEAGEPCESESDITLAMSCDDDEGSGAGKRQQSTANWLEMKKAEKARSTNRSTEQDLLTKELDSYLEEPNVPEEINPLSWWRTNKSKYPSVALVARAYLGIPATSVASERVFSKCGRVCSERRSLLSPQHIEQLVFLAQNLPNDDAV